MSDDYLECGIYEGLDDLVESVTVQIHTKDKEVITIDDLLNDPVFYQGWLSVEHDVFSHRMTTRVQASRVNYLTHYRKAKQVPLEQGDK